MSISSDKNSKSVGLFSAALTFPWTPPDTVFRPEDVRNRRPRRQPPAPRSSVACSLISSPPSSAACPPPSSTPPGSNKHAVSPSSSPPTTHPLAHRAEFRRDGGDGQLGFSELEAQYNPEHHVEATMCGPSSSPSYYSPTWPAEVLSALQLPRLQGGEAEPHAPHINDARTTTACRGAQGQHRPGIRTSLFTVPAAFLFGEMPTDTFLRLHLLFCSVGFLSCRLRSRLQILSSRSRWKRP